MLQEYVSIQHGLSSGKMTKIKSTLLHVKIIQKHPRSNRCHSNTRKDSTHGYLVEISKPSLALNKQLGEKVPNRIFEKVRKNYAATNPKKVG